MFKQWALLKYKSSQHTMATNCACNHCFSTPSTPQPPWLFFYWWTFSSASDCVPLIISLHDNIRTVPLPFQIKQWRVVLLENRFCGKNGEWWRLTDGKLAFQYFYVLHTILYHLYKVTYTIDSGSRVLFGKIYCCLCVCLFYFDYSKGVQSFSSEGQRKLCYNLTTNFIYNIIFM